MYRISNVGLCIFSLLGMEMDNGSTIYYEIPKELILMPYYRQGKHDYSSIVYDQDSQMIIFENRVPWTKKIETRELFIDTVKDFSLLWFAVTHQEMVVGVAQKENPADTLFFINTLTNEILESTLTDKRVEKVNLLKSTAEINNCPKKIFLLDILTTSLDDTEAREKHRIFFSRKPLEYMAEEAI